MQCSKKRKWEYEDESSRKHYSYVKSRQGVLLESDLGFLTLNREAYGLVYMPQPNWQIKEKQEWTFELGDTNFEPNKSYLESLPNELLRDLFEYFPAIDLFRSFYPLNRRFVQLVQETRLRLDFSDLSLCEFDTICTQFDPKNVDSLTLTNADLNVVDDTHSFGQISLFLKRYNLEQFISLKSLRIIEPYNITQLETILNQLSVLPLNHIHVRLRKWQYLSSNHLFSQLLLSTRSLSFHQSDVLESLSTVSELNHLHHLCLSNVSMITLISLLSCMPRLRWLSVQLLETFDSFDDDDTDTISYDLIELSALNTLSIESSSISSNLIQTHLLPRMPNLRSLSIVGYFDETIDTFAEQWKTTIQTHLSRLIDFRFYVTGPVANTTVTIDEFLEPFRQEFWQQRQWYVGVDVIQDTIDYLYTLPCPYIKQGPFRMITDVQQTLTTIPLQYTNSHVNFDSISSLQVSYTNDSNPNRIDRCLYSNVRSLCIDQDDCGTLLGRLIRLSSIRQLTLECNMYHAAFIYLLSMMTGLESLRFNNEIDFLFASLDNMWISDCLRKRAVKKLYIANAEFSRRSDEKDTTFSIGRFIYVFGDSLEHLHLVAPQSTIPFDALINCIPKLKSLTIEWKQTQPPSSQIVQWLEQKTRRTSFVAQCEKEYFDGDIWRIWF